MSECEIEMGKERKSVVIGLPFETEAQRDIVYKLEDLFGKLGITFDTGSDGKTRDWYWDFSLKGNISISLTEITKVV